MSIELNLVKAAIEKEKCSVHGEYPEVRVNAMQLEISTCCDAFHDHLEPVMNQVANEVMNKRIEQISGIFK